MRASSQRREAADGPLMALVNVVRECASPEETTSGRERGGGWSSPYYIRVAKNTPSFPLGHLLSLKKANS